MWMRKTQHPRLIHPAISWWIRATTPQMHLDCTLGTHPAISLHASPTSQFELTANGIVVGSENGDSVDPACKVIPVLSDMTKRCLHLRVVGATNDLAEIVLR